MKSKYSFKMDDAGQPTILDRKDKKKVHFLVPIMCLLIAVLIWMYVAGNDIAANDESGHASPADGFASDVL